MAYEESFVNDVVNTYLSRNPTVDNTPSIVQDISEEKRLGAAKVRAILVRQGVYIAKPKIRTVVEAHDTQFILEEFRTFSAEDDGAYKFQVARSSFVDELRKRSLYTSPALEAFAKSEGVWPLSKAEIERELRGEAERQRTALGHKHRRNLSSKSKSLRSGGPDKWGWILIVRLSLMLVTCINADWSSPTGPELLCIRQGLSC